MTVELFGAADRGRMEAALAVRFTVFVDEQHVPAEEEVDAHDRPGSAARHALVRGEHGTPVAAGRYFPLGAQRIQIGRMAVLPAERGRGPAGASSMRSPTTRARADSRTPSSTPKTTRSRFTPRPGFTPFGATLVECDILHQPMERSL